MENTLLNLIPAAYLPEIHLSQYDVGRTITFTLKDGASDYSVPSGASVKVKATKPSGFGFEVACTFNGGTVTLVTTDTMTPENGRFPAELSIVSGNTTIGTSNFIFNIERSPHPEGTIDGDAETIIPELTLLVERIEAAAEDVDEKAELFLNLSAEAETLPAGSLATANYSDGVLTLGIPRGYDGDDTKADAIVKSASGEVASFTDGGNGLLVKSLNVNIVPKQSGSGDPSPSNVRPISGWSAVKISRMGNGLFFPTQSVSQIVDGITIVSSGGAFHIYGTATSQVISNIFSVNPLTFPSDSAYKLYLGNTVDDSSVEVSFMNGATRIDYWLCSSVNRSVSMPQSAMSGQTCDGLRFKIASGTIVDLYVSPYIAKAGDIEETSISLGQTVYGGTLDVVSGKLTIDRFFINDFSGLSKAMTSIAGGSKQLYVYNLPNPIKNINANVKSDKLACNTFKTLTADQLYSGNQGIASAFGRVYFYSSTLQTIEEWNAYLSNVQVVYELATPTEITLTPTQVKTLLGANNIWSDSGSVEVEYRADTTLAYNELLSLIASLS